MKLDSLFKLLGVVDGAVLAVATGVGNVYPQYKAVCDHVVYVGGAVATAVAYVLHTQAPAKVA